MERNDMQVFIATTFTSQEDVGRRTKGYDEGGPNGPEIPPEEMRVKKRGDQSSQCSVISAHSW